LLLLNVTVSVDDQENVLGQQIRRETAPPAQDNSVTQLPPVKPAQPAVNSASTGQTADEFLNNPNATDGF
jgi:hypothetical protein